MRILIVGLGSMGRRRIRNLSALGHTDIIGVDRRSDRCAAAAEEYGIEVASSVNDVDDKVEIVIVSTSPEGHRAMLEWAADRGLPAFVEASVSSDDEATLVRDLADSAKQVMVPSCTMRYFRGPERVRELVASGIVGRPLLLTHHVGQYLPDWHPWESIGDYYVSNRDTGGCREIVPFEFTWLNEVFGDPRPVFCRRGRVSDLPADIDDLYHSVVEYPGGLIAAVTIEVLSRPSATREFRLVGTEGVITFSGQRGILEVEVAGDPAQSWSEPLTQGDPAPGYVYPEMPYINEMRDFMGAVASSDASLFPNDFGRDARVLGLLNELEAMSR